MEFFIKSFGVKQVATKFNRQGAAAMDMRLAFTKIGLLLMEIEERIFDSQGRRGGGSWKQDTEEWLLRKMTSGLDPRINMATHALRESLTIPGAEGQILHVGAQYLEFGSDLPYAAVTQRERPVMKLIPSDKIEIRAIMRNHLMRAWHAA